MKRFRLYRCWKILLTSALFISGCAQLSRSRNLSDSEDGWAVDVKRMKGTQIVQVMCDANLDGEIDGILLCDGLGNEGIRTLVDSDFDGNFDIQSLEIYDAEHRLKSFYFDLNYDGELDLTLKHPRRGNLIHYAGEWVPARIKTDYEPANGKALDYHRALKKSTFETEQDGKKVTLHFDDEKGFVETK